MVLEKFKEKKPRPRSSYYCRHSLRSTRAATTEEVFQMLVHELHCVWDAREIPEDRAHKGAITCCDECKRQYANYRRRIRAQVKCRLCGRGRRRTSKLEPVLMEHTGVYAKVGTQ
jgi:hypothetical protein